MQTSLKPTASSWDSFKPTLIKVLAEFKPKTVFEYGPGISTLIMQDFPSVEKIETVEHDIAWFHKWANQFGNKVNLILEEDLDNYTFSIFPDNMFRDKKDYDLYFIDGRKREECLDLCNRSNGIVILHDAERDSYKEYINKYKYIFMEDEGHTAVLTNRDDYELRLEKIFSE